MNAIEQFRDAIRAVGLEPPDTVEADGKLRRFASNGKRGDDAGWYVLHDSGIPAGAFGDWRTGISEMWRADIGRKLTPTEEAAHRAKVEAMRREREAEEARQHAEAATKAAEIWKAAQPAPEDHSYLIKKRIGPHGARAHDGKLVIPMRDEAGTLHSLQFINPDGDKTFLTGGRVKGCYFSIGKLDGALCIAEGFATAASIHEATGYAVAVAFNAGNLETVARELRDKFPDVRLILCADDDYRNEVNAGVTKATEAARAVRGFLALPDFGADRPEGATDFNDLSRHAGADAIRRCIEAAAKPAAQPANETNNSKPEPEYMATVRRLAAMPTFEYEGVRVAEAERLNVRISVLDDEVKKLRPREAVPGGALQGKALHFEDPKPWPEPVEGAALLAELAQTFRRFLVLPKHADTVLALWVAFTWFFDRAECAPILAFSSPEPRCGKSHALDVLNRLVRRPLPAANISAAVLFRVIDSSNPTLLLDESDTYNLAENDDLRGIINAGHTKANAFVYRIEGEDREPRGFNVFAPKVFASIGKLVQTVIDRSIEIHMKRKTKRERIERLRHARKAEFERLRQMLARFADDNGQAFTESRPTIPDELSDRQADSWEHLLAIADLAGGDWPKLAREAAKQLSAGGGADAESLGVILLKDVYEVFRPTSESGKPDLDRILGCELTAALIKLEERPWAEYRHGKPISQQQLARRLSNFGVVSNTIRTGAERAKGYKFEQFADAFARYLTIPPFQSVTSGQPNNGAGFEGISSRDKDVNVTTSKAGQPNTGVGCHGGTVSKGGDGGWEIKGDESEAGSVVVI